MLRSVSELRDALSHALSGCRQAWSERAVRQLVLLHACLLSLLCFLPFALPVKMVLLFASALSMVAELLNTAVEAAVDFTSKERHPLAKRAKDVASAAQLTSLILLIILWTMALLHRFL